MSEQSVNQPHWVVGVDVGGTFTDLFVLDEKTGQARIVKVPSTRGEEARGFMNGIAKVTGVTGAEGAKDIATIVHGTTVGTNALLERKIARTGASSPSSGWRNSGRSAASTCDRRRSTPSVRNQASALSCVDDIDPRPSASASSPWRPRSTESRA